MNDFNPSNVKSYYGHLVELERFKQQRALEDAERAAKLEARIATLEARTKQLEEVVAKLISPNVTVMQQDSTRASRQPSSLGVMNDDWKKYIPEYPPTDWLQNVPKETHRMVHVVDRVRLDRRSRERDVARAALQRIDLRGRMS